MKVNSDSLKEDVAKLLEEHVRIGNEVPVEDVTAYRTYIAAAVEFGTSTINHDKIETEEDLVRCAFDVAHRIQTSTGLLMGQVHIKRQ